MVKGTMRAKVNKERLAKLHMGISRNASRGGDGSGTAAHAGRLAGRNDHTVSHEFPAVRILWCGSRREGSYSAVAPATSAIWPPRPGGLKSAGPHLILPHPHLFITDDHDCGNEH